MIDPILNRLKIQFGNLRRESLYDVLIIIPPACIFNTFPYFSPMNIFPEMLSLEIRKCTIKDIYNFIFIIGLLQTVAKKNNKLTR